jgi:hypothetical protein
MKADKRHTFPLWQFQGMGNAVLITPASIQTMSFDIIRMTLTTSETNREFVSPEQAHVHRRLRVLLPQRLHDAHYRNFVLQ